MFHVFKYGLISGTNLIAAQMHMSGLGASWRLMSSSMSR